MKQRIHALGAAAYAVGGLGLFVVSNLQNRTNLLRIAVVTVVLTAAWMFSRRNVRDSLIATRLLMAAPFAWVALVCLIMAVVELQQGGLFTGALVATLLAGAVSMGTIAGFFVGKAITVIRTREAPIEPQPDPQPDRHPGPR